MLSVDRVVSETLALIDEQGIPMASMRSVGDRLGVRAMSLNRYASSREELFDLVVERVVDELAADPEVHPRPVDGWRDYLERLAWGVRRYAFKHPHVFRWSRRGHPTRRGSTLRYVHCAGSRRC